MMLNYIHLFFLFNTKCLFCSWMGCLCLIHLIDHILFSCLKLQELLVWDWNLTDLKLQYSLFFLPVLKFSNIDFTYVDSHLLVFSDNSVFASAQRTKVMGSEQRVDVQLSGNWPLFLVPNHDHTYQIFLFLYYIHLCRWR